MTVIAHALVALIVSGFGYSFCQYQKENGNDIARKVASMLRYMADHNGLEDELDDSTNVLDDSSDVMVS